jgi:putative transcriptional regulator
MRRAENRIRIVLIEQRRPEKWLAAELGVTHTTVSRWCTNLMQPSLEKLYQIADVLNVDVRTLLKSSLKKNT